MWWRVRAGLIPVLCAGQNPLIMQMAQGVTIEGHLLCAPWVAAGGKASSRGPHPTPSSVLSPQGPFLPVLLPCSLRRPEVKPRRRDECRGWKGGSEEEEGLSMEEKEPRGQFLGLRGSRGGEEGSRLLTDKSICWERPGCPSPQLASTLVGSAYGHKAEPSPCDLGTGWGREDARAHTPHVSHQCAPTCPSCSHLSGLGFGRSLQDLGRES